MPAGSFVSIRTRRRRRSRTRGPAYTGTSPADRPEAAPGSLARAFGGGVLPCASLTQIGGRCVSEPTPLPTLYERLGGVYSVAAVVDDFVDRGMADPRLYANPAVDDAHHKVPP